MDGQSKIRIGIVGASFAANLHLNAYARCPQAEIVAICGEHPERARAMAE